MEIILFGLLILISGAIASFVSGLFGIGGGIILVPVFVIVFEHFSNVDIGTHTAVGTSLAVIIANASLSVKKQIEFGNIDFTFFKKWVIGLIFGIITSGILLFFISGMVLKILFLIMLIFGLSSLIFKKQEDPSAKIIPKPKFSLIFLGGYFISCLAVLLGIGGGSFIVAYSKTVFKFPMKKAIAIASLSGLCIGIGGTILAIITGILQPLPTIEYSVGYVNVLALLLVLPFCIWLPPKGVAFSNKISEQTNRKLFIGLLIICIVVMLVKIIEQ